MIEQISLVFVIQWVRLDIKMLTFDFKNSNLQSGPR